jgi:thioredoxin-related protein
MSRYYILITSVSLLLLIILSSAYYVDREEHRLNQDEVSVEWLSFEEAVEKSKSEKRKIFIDVYTDWCGWCKVMDKKTFSEATIATYLNEKYYAVKLDAEQTEDIIFRDHTFKFVPNGRRGYHELAAWLLQGKLSYPTVVFLDEDFNPIQPLPGYREPKEFHPILTFFGEDQHKSMDWNAYQRVYDSPYN